MAPSGSEGFKSKKPVSVPIPKFDSSKYVLSSEECELWEKPWALDIDSRVELIQFYQRKSLAVAKRLFVCASQMEDVCQEAYFAISNALDVIQDRTEWDIPTKDAYVRKSIKNAIGSMRRTEGKTRHKVNQLHANFERTQRHLSQELRRRPTKHEVYDELSWDVDTRLDYERRIRLHQQTGFNVVSESAFAADQHTSQNLEHREDAEVLRNAIDELPAQQKKVLILQMHGDTLQSIADQTGLTVSQVRTRLDNAKATLKATLKGE